MRYEPGGRASPGPRMERGGTMTALRQCARDPDCMSVGVEYQGDSEMFQKLQHSPSTEDRGQLVRDERCAFFVKVCLSGVEDMCSGLWAFDRVPDMALRGHNDIVTDWVSSREECQELCLKNVQLPCRSAEYSVGFLTCVQSRESRRTRPEDFEVSEGTEYLENQCAPVETDCEFQDTVDKFLPYSDRRITGVAYKEDCERQCNGERAFNCKSFSYSSRRQECSLSSEDAATLPRIELESAPGMVFSQQSDCESVRVECSEREMVITLQFGRPFEGRVFALGGPQTCFSVGDGRSRLQLAIPMDSRRCGTEQEGRTLFVNHVVVQNHPLITQQADRTVRVECRLEAQDQVISLPHSELGDAGVQVAYVRRA